LRVHNGNFEVHSSFRSRFLQHDRDIIVYLPPGYHASPERRYPVCYMHDGQNLFDPATAFGGNDWQLHEVAEELIEACEISPLIIVGINNTGEARMLEYTHVRKNGRRGGLARAYGRAIVQELKPLIDGQYRTLTDARFTTLGGSSLGGLVSAYLGMQHPAVFGNLILMSPSVWWAARDILKHIAAPRKAPRPKVWLDVGTEEGSDPAGCISDVRALRDAFLASGWQLGKDLMYHEEEGAQHNERAWGRRMGPALRFLYSDSATFVS
jgi:predicted alpha/beta superfamily hydrolase